MLLVLACLPALAWAQCSSGPSPSSGIQPSIASGYAWAVAATGLTSPRGLQFDSAGNLLVVEEGKGLSSFKVDDQSQADSACGITLTDQKTLVDDSELNHGLALSTDQGALFVSSSSEARAYTYDPETNAVGSNPATIVKNMDNSDHTSRTLLYPRNATGAQLVVSRGSSENLDAGAADVRNGRSQVKAFNVTGVPRDGYDFARDGTLLGHGLRNSVGVAEHPVTGGIWTVENSADNIRRGGEDVHANNPGEELNFLGYLNGTRYARQGTDFGYPDCFAAWQPDELPENQGFEVGSTFALDPSGDSSRCGNVTAPSLTWQAHMVGAIGFRRASLMLPYLFGHFVSGPLGLFGSPFAGPDRHQVQQQRHRSLGQLPWQLEPPASRYAPPCPSRSYPAPPLLTARSRLPARVRALRQRRARGRPDLRQLRRHRAVQRRPRGLPRRLLPARGSRLRRARPAVHGQRRVGRDLRRRPHGRRDAGVGRRGAERHGECVCDEHADERGG